MFAVFFALVVDINCPDESHIFPNNTLVIDVFFTTLKKIHNCTSKRFKNKNASLAGPVA